MLIGSIWCTVTVTPYGKMYYFEAFLLVLVLIRILLIDEQVLLFSTKFRIFWPMYLVSLCYFPMYCQNLDIPTKSIILWFLNCRPMSNRRWLTFHLTKYWSVRPAPRLSKIFSISNSVSVFPEVVSWCSFSKFTFQVLQCELQEMEHQLKNSNQRDFVHFRTLLSRYTSY